MIREIDRRRIGGLMALVAVAGLALGVLRALGPNPAALLVAGIGLCAWPVAAVEGLGRAVGRPGSPIARRARVLAARGSAGNALLGVVLALHPGRLDVSVLIVPGFFGVLIAAIAGGMMGLGLLLDRGEPPCS